MPGQVLQVWQPAQDRKGPAGSCYHQCRRDDLLGEYIGWRRQAASRAGRASAVQLFINAHSLRDGLLEVPPDQASHGLDAGKKEEEDVEEFIHIRTCFSGKNKSLCQRCLRVGQVGEHLKGGGCAMGKRGTRL